jgi:hypothetical protein
MSSHVTKRATACGILALALLALPAAAQEPSKQMSPEEQKMMESWQKAMTPGPEHAELAAMAGNWSFESTWWVTPGAPPEKSSGTVERSMLLGGRVLMEQVEGTMLQLPFEGVGMMGFDNVTGKWWGTWSDNMGTGMMSTTGSCADKKCEFTGSYNDPMTGGLKTMRMTSEHGPDRETHVMYDKGADGKEMKVGEMVYTRKK